MRIAAVLLAEAATSRDGLLSVLNAGINVFNVEELPSGLQASLGVIVEMESTERHPFEITVDIYRGGAGEDTRLGGLVAQWEPGDGKLLVEELPLNIPIGVPLSPVIVKEVGMHEIHVVAGAAEPVILRFYVSLEPPSGS